MKKIIYITTLVGMIASCSLKEDHDAFTNRENSYDNFAQCQACVDACYIPIKEFYDVNYCWAVEVPTDLWYVETRNPDPICQISPAQPGYAAPVVWTQCYKAIMRANECIECISKSSIDETSKNTLVAEARVLRALYYYHLTNFFGDVPYYDYMVKDLTTQEKIRLLPRTDANEIRRILYDDIKVYALPYLTPARTCEISGNRAGHALGLMLMAKFAMWYKDWDAAEDALEQLELIYEDFNEERYPLDDTRWSKKNTPESIFEIQHAWSATGIKFQGKLCRTYYPASIAKKWDDNDVKGGKGAWLDGTYEGWLDDVYMPQWGKEIPQVSVIRTTYHVGCMRDGSSGMQQETTHEAYCAGDRLFDPLPLKWDLYNTQTGRWNVTIDTDALEKGVNDRGQKIDRRIRYTLGLGNMDPDAASYGGVYGETFREVRTDGRPYAGEKFWVPDMMTNYDSNNYKIFRYADAILMMAEVKCMKREFQTALEYVEMIRNRAGMDTDKSLSDEKSVMKLIRDERARELMGELHRKYDLVRWGIWYEETRKYVPYKSYSENIRMPIYDYIQPHHAYMPIPDTECALTIDPQTGKPVLDNPAYKGVDEDFPVGDDSENVEEII